MIRGEGEVLFDLPGFQLGSIISFEGGFARYSREMANLGADLIVVATNEGSYGLTPASDQFIGMTRMRSAETGLDLIHAAVTGKSVIVTDGGVLGEKTGLGTQEVLFGEVTPRPGLTTPYVRFGEWVSLVAILGGIVAWTRSRPRVPRGREVSEVAV
jgi:apolipoprotein N-acyltransferase